MIWKSKLYYLISVVVCRWLVGCVLWRQHPTRHQLYGHQPPVTETMQVRRTRLAGHCWRSKDELISEVLLWTPAYGQAKAGRQARTYIQQLCEDTGCSPEDLPEAMNDWEKWRERVRDIRASGMTWWWWWWNLVCYLKSIEDVFVLLGLKCWTTESSWVRTPATLLRSLSDKYSWERYEHSYPPPLRIK